jgi:hypothetical protein
VRFYYVVRPASDRWEVSFGEAGTRFVYPGREEALQVALGAALRHWQVQHRPSGVRIEGAGMAPEVVAEYGDLPCPSPQS